jgi:hypothetical protein
LFDYFFSQAQPSALAVHLQPASQVQASLLAHLQAFSQEQHWAQVQAFPLVQLEAQDMIDV